MVDTSRYVVLAQFTAQEGQLDDLLAHVKKIRDHSLANEEGTKVYVPTQSATNPKDISIWEEYADEAAFNKHCEHEYFLDFAKSLDTLLEGGKSSIKILKQNAF